MHTRANRAAGQDHRADDLRAAGVPADQIAAWLAQLDEAPDDGGDPDAATALADDLDGQQGDTGPLCIWPDNAQAFALWMAMQTQWRSNPWTAALQGLRHDVLHLHITRTHAPADQQDELWLWLIEMEQAAVTEDARLRAQDPPERHHGHHR